MPDQKPAPCPFLPWAGADLSRWYIPAMVACHTVCLLAFCVWLLRVACIRLACVSLSVGAAWSFNHCCNAKRGRSCLAPVARARPPKFRTHY